MAGQVVASMGRAGQVAGQVVASMGRAGQVAGQVVASMGSGRALHVATHSPTSSAGPSLSPHSV